MEPGGRSSGSPTWLRRIIQIALTIGLTWLIVNRVDVTLNDALDMGPAVPNPSLPLLAASVVALLTGLVVSAWLWGRLAAELGRPSPRLLDSVRIVFSANLGRYIPGKLWQIAGLVALSSRVGVNPSVAGAAGVLGQGFALGAAGILASPILLGPGRADPEAGVAALVALVLFVGITSVRGALSGLLALASRIIRLPPMQLPDRGHLFGLRWLGWYLLNWAAYGVAFVLFVRSLGFTAGWAVLVSAFAGAYLLGYLAVFAPAGLGVREGFLIAFLTPAIGPPAAGVALLTRLWMTLVELAPAGLLAFWEIARSRQLGDARSGPEEP